MDNAKLLRRSGKQLESPNNTLAALASQTNVNVSCLAQHRCLTLPAAQTPVEKKLQH